MKKLNLIMSLLTAFALSAFLVGCNPEKVKESAQNYDLGDLSVKYCASTTEAQRVVLREVLNTVAASSGVHIGVNYCDVFETLRDGYTVGDITKIWCGATDAAVRAQIRMVFAEKLSSSGVVLSEIYCQMMAPDKERPEPEGNGNQTQSYCLNFR